MESCKITTFLNVTRFFVFKARKAIMTSNGNVSSLTKEAAEMPTVRHCLKQAIVCKSFESEQWPLPSSSRRRFQPCAIALHPAKQLRDWMVASCKLWHPWHPSTLDWNSFSYCVVSLWGRLTCKLGIQKLAKGCSWGRIGQYQLELGTQLFCQF